MHEIGSDDVHPAPDFDTAQRWCDYANDAFKQHADISRFVVAPWPWDAPSHAESLPKAISGWNRKDGTPVYGPKDTELTTLRAENEMLREQGEFLLDRLDEFLPELTEGKAAREFYGHVAPAASRFRNALAQVAK